MTEVIAISSYNTFLKWGSSKSDLEKKVDIADFGDLMGAPNMIDVTTLSHNRQAQIPGILTGDAIAFTVRYTTENMKTCQEDEGKALCFRITFQDGSGYDWQGQYKISVPGAGVDDPINFALNVSVSSDMEWFEEED